MEIYNNTSSIMEHSQKSAQQIKNGLQDSLVNDECHMLTQTHMKEKTLENLLVHP